METSVESELQLAMQALSNQDSEAAITLLEALFDREASLAEVSEMFARGIYATALAAAGRIPDAYAAATRAHALATKLEDPESAAHYAGLVHQLEIIGMSDEAIEMAFNNAANALDRGDYATAETELNTILIAALSHLRVDVEASARGMLAQALLLRGAHAEARPHVERALAIAKELGDSDVYEHFEHLLEALSSDSSADQYRLELDISKRAEELQEHAGKAMEVGDFDLAVNLLRPLADEAQAANLRETEASVRGMLAQSLLMGDKRQESVPEAKRALELAEALGAKEAADSFRQLLQLAIGWGTPVEEA